MTQAYCVRCRNKNNMKNEKQVSMKGKGKNGKERFALTGNCEKCNTKMFKILGMKK